MLSERDKSKRRWQFGLKELFVGVVGVCVLAWWAKIVHRTEPDTLIWVWSVVALSLPLASLIFIVFGRGRVGVCLFLVWIALGLFAAIMIPAVQ